MLNSIVPGLTIEASLTVGVDTSARLFNSFISSHNFSSTNVRVLLLFVCASLYEFTSEFITKFPWLSF